MICCAFIARDEEEFSRYPTDEYGELRSDCVRFIRFKVTGDYITLILSSDAKDADVRKMCMKVAAAINLVAEKSNDVVKYDEADKVCVFVHMGGEGEGGVERWEKALNTDLQKEDSKSAVPSPENKEFWSICLLSSTRPEILDVKRNPIKMPEKLSEYLMMISHCSAGDSLSKKLTDYVCMSKNIKLVEFDVQVIERIVLDESCPGWMQERLKDIKKNIKKEMLEYKDNFAAFFSYLMREGLL